MNSELFRLWRQSRQNILILVASLFWIGNVSAQATDVVEQFLGNQEFSGVVQVRNGNNTRYERAFNVDAIASDFEVSTDSAFMIASITKSFTAVLVLDQVSKGRIELDASLATYLPDFDADYASDVTIRQLLQNRSGIPHYTDIPGWFDPEVKDAFTKASFLDVIASLEFKFPPGTDYYYSNANYYLLGLVLDAATGERYEDLLQKTILDPLGLTETGQIYAADESIAPTYIRTGGGYESITISNAELFRATASQYATASDLARFMRGLASGKLLDANMLAVLFDKAHPMGFTVTSAPVGDDETEVITYNGELAGTTSMLSWFPEQDLTITILSNNNTPYSTLVGLTLELARHAIHDSNWTFTYLKANDGNREALREFIEANWFAMDAIAVERGLFKSYRLIENLSETSSESGTEWDFIVAVEYFGDQTYADVRQGFEQIREQHETVLIDGKSLRDLGSIVGSERVKMH